jgi:hypothetical protein
MVRQELEELPTRQEGHFAGDRGFGGDLIGSGGDGGPQSQGSPGPANCTTRLLPCEQWRESFTRPERTRKIPVDGFPS